MRKLGTAAVAAFTLGMAVAAAGVWQYYRHGQVSASAAAPVWAAPTALSIGFNDHSDAVIATAVSDGRRAAEAESAVLEFLNGDVVMYWAKLTLGL